ncbi:hypothetical protein [Roseateles sp.]|uniref:hypothetical protein n=1 Tax=Roseateles sp. TaxID=1971397 RepID=UPI0031DBBCDA
MDFSEIASRLGYYFGEREVSELVNALEIVEKPQLPKGDDTAYLVSEQRGVELTFVDERYLDAPPTREYPEGALVLNNVRFYGVAGSRFKRFDGELPHGLAFGQTLDELKAKLGATTWESSDSDRARWDQPDHLIFAGFDDQGRADVYALQMLVVEE